MFELENSSFDITSSSWRLCRMWYLGYNALEAIIKLSTGRNGMRTSNMVREHSESRHSTQLQFEAASKLDLLSTLSSSTSKASLVGSPTPHAKARPDLHLWTHVQNGAGMFDESETEDGITDEECSDMEMECIPLPKLKREIRRADLTSDQMFLCCMPRPAVPVDQMYKMQASSDDDGLDPVPRKLPI